MTITAEELVATIDELALAQRPVMVHASLRSFGMPVEGGADAVLDALLSRGCTVLVPSFTEPQFGVVPPTTMRPARNGIDYAVLDKATPRPQAAANYTVDCEVINSGMGVLPARLLARGKARRGRHPLNSFAAVGPQAAELVAAQTPTNVYGPVRTLADENGAILLLGVELNRMTALHLAEQDSGRRLPVRWARAADNRVIMVETGSCSEGFPRLEPWLRSLPRTARVSESRWSAYPAKETLAAAVAAMTADQSVTHCADAACLACRDSVAGGPIGPIPLG
ncbi:AAC(3) family N-acetyltransferase [Streptomyces sp. BA2]|uniref:AAC(3) family N-acetyltransferase n=1 Tax=Streptomyces sp. BA2 TaxID=436595 RepID=UPI00132A866B|nr:AAC(3) family N-acetyltransferase [Streptomyces sp. BA2]MWA08298.1 aminoglycoside N(3)-acetyltransferase [Streptomyces sp. BA2]